METMQLTWKVICVVVIIGFICCVNGAQILGEKIHFNYIVQLGYYNNATTHDFDSFVPIQLSECLDKCERIHACEFINYYPRLRQCIVITTPRPTTRTIVQHPGGLYANKSEWDVTKLPTECQSCTFYGECVTVPPSNHTCLKKGCGNAMYVRDSRQYGNTYRFDNKVKYVCDVSGTSAVKVCQKDEQWSHSNFTCDITTVPSTTATDDRFQTATLSDGNNFSYHISTTEMTKDEGAVYCNSNYGQLVEVYTIAKFEFLQNILETTEAYETNDFYIDGSYDDQTTNWYTSNGNEIPTTLQLWDNEASYDGSVVCVEMSRTTFFLEDVSCSQNKKIICEKL